MIDLTDPWARERARRAQRRRAEAMRIDDSDIEDTLEAAAEPTERRPLVTPEAFLMVQNLISLVINPKEVRRHLRSLHDALAAVDAAEKRLNDDRVAHDAHVAKTTAELEARAAKLAEGERGLELKKEWREDDLLAREARINRLEASWRGLPLPGADNFECFGGLVRDPPRTTPLEKAKFYSQHGRLPHVDENLNAPVATPPVEQSRTVRAGPGDTSEFLPNVTLTRSPEQPAGGARVRGRRGAAHV
jgi:hypothetical protein